LIGLVFGLWLDVFGRLICDACFVYSRVITWIVVPGSAKMDPISHTKLDEIRSPTWVSETDNLRTSEMKNVFG